MRKHEEDIDECIHVINTCDKCSSQSKTGNQIDQHKINIHESNKIICNKCNLSCNGKNKLNTHIKDKHKSYKPCIKFGAGHCDTVKCRFRHIKLSGNDEICYKCGHISHSKTENITHIKYKHGNEICYKFVQNQCGRRSENCLYTHQTAPIQEQQDIAAENVEKVPTRNISQPSQDFPALPTAGQPGLMVGGQKQNVAPQEIMTMISHMMTQLSQVLEKINLKC